MPFVTFIIPTIGRSTLGRTLASLLNQTCKDWDAIVVRDGWIGDKSNYDNIKYISTEKLGRDNVGALVRNVGIKQAQGEWIANLDDDDTVSSNYVEWLKEESKDADLILFRTQYENGEIRPKETETKMPNSAMCNSFAFRRDFAEMNDLKFRDHNNEDIEMIMDLIKAGARAKLSKEIAYFFRR